MSEIQGDRIQRAPKIASILDQLQEQEELVASIERRFGEFTQRMFNYYMQAAIYDQDDQGQGDAHCSVADIMSTRIGRTQQVLLKISAHVDEMISELPMDERTKEPTRT